MSYKTEVEDNLNDHRKRITQEAYDNPLPGDYWNEMFCPYFVVLQINPDGTLIICDQRKDTDDGKWTWNLKHSRQVTRDYMKRVRYDSIDGFVADVFNRCSHLWAVDEWHEMGKPYDKLEEPTRENDIIKPLYKDFNEKPLYRDFNEYFRTIAPHLWNVKQWDNETVKAWLENAFLDARMNVVELPKDTNE